MLLVTALWLGISFIIPLAKSIAINIFLAQTATNVASAANGGTASASSELSSPSVAIDGVKNWATTGAWKDATPDSYPDWLQVVFSGSKTINEIDVFAVTDDFTNPADPTESTTFSLYGITNFDVQYWTGSAWQTVPNGSITNNNKAITKITFTAITTTKIRVVVNAAQAGYSRIVELEAWSGGASTDIPPSPSNDDTLTGSIDYLNSSPAGILYNFNELNFGSYWNFISFRYAKFSTTFARQFYIGNLVGNGFIHPRFIQTTPDNLGDVIVEFSEPVRNLSFSAVGVNGGTFKVNIYHNNTVTQRVIDARCGMYVICYTDLRDFNNVTAIVIHSINDPAGLGFDDFNFDIGSPTPTPTPTPNQNPIGALERIDSETDIAHGWARDPDSTSAIRVDFYVDALNCPNGPNSCSAYAGNALANTPHSIQGNRGFQFSIPARFRDGQTHTLYAHAVDTNGSNTTHLSGSPISFRITPKVKSIVLESKFNCASFEVLTPGCLYFNPGNGNSGTDVGLRIFPEKLNPSDGDINRKTVTVKATVGVANTWVYFRNFDVDDPSYNVAPVDDDSGTNIDKPDNRGSIGGLKEGLLICSQNSALGTCQAKTDANGIATVDFRVTMQPGDNFEIAASTDEQYLRGIRVSATDLRDSAGQLIPISESVSANAKRSHMLTVWRFVHIEVDSMGTVQNNHFSRLIGDTVTVGSTSVTVPYYNITKGIQPNRFESGKMVVGSDILEIDSNTAIDFTLRSAGAPVSLFYGQTFVAFDDDNYNNVHVPGTFADNGEDIGELEETFSKMRESDLESRNSFVKAYIRPEYSWAASRNYNQSNVPFVLNVQNGNELDQINPYRGSRYDEDDEFWVAYLQLSYQGDVQEDNDPFYTEDETGGVSCCGYTDNDPPPPPRRVLIRFSRQDMSDR